MRKIFHIYIRSPVDKHNLRVPDAAPPPTSPPSSPPHSSTLGRAFVRHLERAELTRGRNEREQHFPQYRHAVHQIVQGGRRR